MANEEQASVVRSHVFISGRIVQEGAFRDALRRQAQELGLRGWVRNIRDGRVEAVFEGEPEAVRRMTGWCYSNRSGAEVHATAVCQETPSRDLINFEAG